MSAKRRRAKSIPPLALEICDDAYCQGYVVRVLDEDRLAEAVARVMLRQCGAALAVLLGSDETAPVPQLEIEALIARRLVPPVPVFHRDGLLFQIIMWLASHLDKQDNDVVLQPQVLPAAKGQDSVIVRIAQGGSGVAALFVCEDKATKNPRDTVRDKVWPEIVDYDSGGRDDELLEHAITALVATGVSRDDAETTAIATLWSGVRRYRVRVTVGNSHSSPPARGKLFKGFSQVAKGGQDRRRGETMYVPNLRPWMKQFSARVEAALRASKQVT